MSEEKMNPGEVIRTVRDAIKSADFPGNKRVARKGSHILFTVGDQTYTCAIKRVNPKSVGRNSPTHEDSDIDEPSTSA